MRYWRDCLVLVREVECEEKEGGGREEMWLYNRETRGDVVDFDPSEQPGRKSPREQKTGSFDRLHRGSTLSRQ